MKFPAIPLLAALLLTATLPAHAWGPRAQVSVVNTAAQLLIREVNAPLRRYDKEIRDGASVPNELLFSMHPEAQSNPVRAIENEIYLLQALPDEQVSAYMAYRLGVLGKLVARITAPLYEAPVTYSNLYYADAENGIQRAELKNRDRRQVDPDMYFAQRQREARVNDEVIIREYQAGTGFEGVARNTLPEAASRSVNAVADVWYTILASNTVPGSVSEEQRRNYVAGAMAFYAQRGNRAEMDQARERLSRIVSDNAELVERIGDAFYDAGVFDKAIREYERVLEMDPNRREVVSKISAYYVERGESAIEENRLEDARDAFRSAIAADGLNAEAEARRMDAERQIMRREERHEASKTALERGGEFVRMAEQEALNNRFAEALALFRQAEHSFQEVSEEFPVEFQRGQQALRNVRFQSDEMKQELIANAQSFSGRGYGGEARSLAAARLDQMSEITLKGLVQLEYESRSSALQSMIDARSEAL